MHKEVFLMPKLCVCRRKQEKREGQSSADILVWLIGCVVVATQAAADKILLNVQSRD